MALKRKYQVWLTEDDGTRIAQIEQWAFLNYSRIVHGIPICNLGLPFAKYGDMFQKDRHIEVWRSPTLADKRRLEDVFFIQQQRIYTRKEDGVTIQELRGEGSVAMLDRRIEKYKAGTSQATKTANIDDMMKEFVDENMGAAALADDADRARPYNAGQFRVQPDSSQGASVTHSAAYANLQSLLRELHEISKISTPPIYFDVIPITPQLFEFQTFLNQRGQDRRYSAGQSSFVFSLENGNLEQPEYEEDYFEARNVIYAGGQGEESDRTVEERTDTAREMASLWARSEAFRDARNEATTAGVQAKGDGELELLRPSKRFVANFLDREGSRYGVNWDLGDKHTALYAGLSFDIEIKIVYVTVQTDGSEKVYARNEFGAFGE